MFLDASTDGAGDALIDAAQGRSLSHRALREAAASTAERLAGERSLLFLFCHNDAATVVTYLACAQAGHAVALLDGAMGAEQRQALLARYRPEWLVGAEPIGDEAWNETEAGPTRMWHRSSGHGGELHPELFLLLSTSGSTGSPQLVRLTQAAVEANARSIREALRIDGAERAVASLPLHYSYGLSVLNSHLCAGASVMLTEESVLSPTFWELVRHHRCTSMPGVPYSYQMLARVGFERMELPSLRTLTQAGGRLAVPLVERFHGIMTDQIGRASCRERV